MTVMNGSSLTTSVIAGLTNAYSILSAQNKNGKGLKLENLTNPSAETLAGLGYNTNFLSYLTNNFSTIDKDRDGIISSSELSNLTATMQNQGLTKSEISNLCASGSNSTLYQTVLEYFDKIDTNNDGRVTQEEISAFSFKAQRHKMETQYKSFKSNSASLYYSEDTEETPVSVTDVLYPDV